MLPELIIAGLVAIAIFLLWKLLLRVIVVAIALGIVMLFLKGNPEFIGKVLNQVSGCIQVAFDYGSSIVEKLL